MRDVEPRDGSGALAALAGVAGMADEGVVGGVGGAAGPLEDAESVLRGCLHEQRGRWLDTGICTAEDLARLVNTLGNTARVLAQFEFCGILTDRDLLDYCDKAQGEIDRVRRRVAERDADGPGARGEGR